MPAIKKLEPQRQLDVCLQCHLMSDVTVARGEPKPFRPGDRLSDRRVDYFEVDKAEAFVAVGHGLRMESSKCFKESGGRMTCTLCHDPHGSVRTTPRAVYNERCNECHQTALCKRPLKDHETPRQGDCVSCHMPVRVADNIPHASATDHWIQLPGRPTGAGLPPAKEPGAKLVALPPGGTAIEDAFALARLLNAKRALEGIRTATQRLEELLRQSPAPNAAPWAEVARGYLDLDELPKARDAARRAVNADPLFPAARERLALIDSRLGDHAGAAEVLEKGLRAQPWCFTGDESLVDALSKTRGEQRVFDLYERYLQFHPPKLALLMSLGDMKQRVKAPHREAESFYLKAKAADGASPLPFLALARLALSDGAFTSAASYAHDAVVRAPRDPSARALEASARARLGDDAGARSAAEKALALDPTNREARRVLSRLDASLQGRR
jgi:tetratricopeptide (TPR) repeat protein